MSCDCNCQIVSKQEVPGFSAYFPSEQQFRFWPQLSVVAVMAVGRLGPCLSLSTSFCLPACLCLSVLSNWQKQQFCSGQSSHQTLCLLLLTLSLAPSLLSFALCHQSATVSKNSSIVIVTDVHRFSGPPPCRTQEAASHVLFIGLVCLFWLHSISLSVSVLLSLCLLACSDLDYLSYCLRTERKAQNKIISTGSALCSP